jgi:hypothetical protein
MSARTQLAAALAAAASLLPLAAADAPCPALPTPAATNLTCFSGYSGSALTAVAIDGARYCAAFDQPCGGGAPPTACPGGTASYRVYTGLDAFTASAMMGMASAYPNLFVCNTNSCNSAGAAQCVNPSPTALPTPVACPASIAAPAAADLRCWTGSSMSYVVQMPEGSPTGMRVCIAYDFQCNDATVNNTACPPGFAGAVRLYAGLDAASASSLASYPSAMMMYPNLFTCATDGCNTPAASRCFVPSPSALPTPVPCPSTLPTPAPADLRCWAGSSVGFVVQMPAGSPTGMRVCIAYDLQCTDATVNNTACPPDFRGVARLYSGIDASTAAAFSSYPDSVRESMFGNLYACASGDGCNSVAASRCFAGSGGGGGGGGGGGSSSSSSSSATPTRPPPGSASATRPLTPSLTPSQTPSQTPSRSQSHSGSPAATPCPASVATAASTDLRCYVGTSDEDSLTLTPAVAGVRLCGAYDLLCTLTGAPETCPSGFSGTLRVYLGMSAELAASLAVSASTGAISSFYSCNGDACNTVDASRCVGGGGASFSALPTPSASVTRAVASSSATPSGSPLPSPRANLKCFVSMSAGGACVAAGPIPFPGVPAFCTLWTRDADGAAFWAYTTDTSRAGVFTGAPAAGHSFVSACASDYCNAGPAALGCAPFGATLTTAVVNITFGGVDMELLASVDGVALLLAVMRASLERFGGNATIRHIHNGVTGAVLYTGPPGGGAHSVRGGARRLAVGPVVVTADLTFQHPSTAGLLLNDTANVASNLLADLNATGPLGASIFAGANATVVATVGPTTPVTSPGGGGGGGGSGGLSAGAIIGIILGALAGVVLVAAVALYARSVHRQHAAPVKSVPAPEPAHGAEHNNPMAGAQGLALRSVGKQ